MEQAVDTATCQQCIALGLLDIAPDMAGAAVVAPQPWVMQNYYYAIVQKTIVIKVVIVIIKFTIVTVTSTCTIGHLFVNVTLIWKSFKTVHFNNILLVGKFFGSIALTMHSVGVTTNCEKIAIS